MKVMLILFLSIFVLSIIFVFVFNVMIESEFVGDLKVRIFVVWQYVKVLGGVLKVCL